MFIGDVDMTEGGPPAYMVVSGSLAYAIHPLRSLAEADIKWFLRPQYPAKKFEIEEI